MRKLTSILIVVAVVFASCKKEEKIHPYYPHTLKLTNSKVTYNAWVKGVDQTMLLPYEYFFEGQLSDYTGWNTITFLNDSLFYWGEKPSYNTDEEMLKNAEHYFIRGDTIYHDYWFSMMEFVTPTYIVRILGIGNRNEFINYQSEYTIAKNIPFWSKSILESDRLMDWNSFILKYPVAINDSLAVVNMTYKYH